jgi:amylosucrase
MHATLVRLGEVRASLPTLHAAVESELVETPNPSVLAVVRRHAAGDLVQLYNVSEEWQRVPVRVLGTLAGAPVVDRLGDETPRVEDHHLVLPPYAALWLTAS